MAKRYSEKVALMKAELKAAIKGGKVLPSVRYQHGLGRHIPVAMDYTRMSWVDKGIYGLHGNMVEPVAFLTGFAPCFRGAHGKVEDLPPVAYGLKLAKVKGLTVRPGRHKVYTAEATATELVEIYGDRARRALDEGRKAGEEVRAKAGISVSL